jgi:cephalosporin-C deacetylase-like acetyl esterase
VAKTNKPEMKITPANFWSGVDEAEIHVPDVRLEAEPVEDEKLYRVYECSFWSSVISPYQVNNTVYGRLVIGKDLPEEAPIAILLHGLTAHSHYYEMLEAKNLLCAGVHSLLLSMPYHFERIPLGTEAGDLMFSADLDQTMGAVRQAVADTLAALRWCLERGHRAVGVSGLSGGGLAACLAATRANFAFLVGIAPAVDWAALMWQGLVSKQVSDSLKVRFGSYEELKTALRPLDPSTFQPRVPKGRILLVEGLYDQVVLPEQVEALWRSWEEPPIARLPRGHFTMLTSAQLYKAVKDFMVRAMEGATGIACPDISGEMRL